MRSYWLIAVVLASLGALYPFVRPLFGTSVTVTLYPNGEVKDGVVVTLTSSQFPTSVSFFEVIGQYKRAPVQGVEGGVIPASIVNQRGQSVSSYFELYDGDELFLVAPGLRFVWPFRGVGTTVRTPVPDRDLVMTTMADSPRVFHIPGFLSAEEAQAMIDNAEKSGAMALSGVGLNTGETSSQRTSTNTFDSTSPTAQVLLRRAFALLGLERNTELEDGLQVVRYEPRQAYIAHTDWFTPESFPHVGDGFVPAKGGSNRYATVFLYLNDLEEGAGGQTAFPNADPLPSQNLTVPESAATVLGEDTWELNQTKECYAHLAFKPKQGDAILFYSQKGDGELDGASLHSGCPVLTGIKWAANLWVWNGPRPANMINGIGFQFENLFEETVNILYNNNVLATLESGKRITFTSYVGHAWTVEFVSTPGTTVWTHTMSDSDRGSILRIAPEGYEEPAAEEGTEEGTEEVPEEGQEDLPSVEEGQAAEEAPTE